ncbi:MAG: aminotransferase class III-fold pyridoxal phosphate-dependent enzyme [Planctomycetota bacterium]
MTGLKRTLPAGVRPASPLSADQNEQSDAPEFAGSHWIDATVGRVSMTQNAIHPQPVDAMLLGGSFGGPFLEAADREMLDTLKSLQTHFQPIAATLTANAAEALQHAVARVRRADRFRLLCIIGADHGDDILGRSTGSVESLRESFGPLMAGITHVSPEDTESVSAAMDDSVAAILVSPTLLAAGGRVLSPRFLEHLADICHASQAALIVDQRGLPPLGAGRFFAHEAIAEIPVDAVLMSAGCFGGYPGGAIFWGPRFQAGGHFHHGGHPASSPWHRSLFLQPLETLANDGDFEQADANAEAAAKDIAESVAEFRFIRDLHRLGTSIGLELDIESAGLVAACHARGLYLETSGRFGVQMHLPQSVDAEDLAELLRRLRDAFADYQSTLTASDKPAELLESDFADENEQTLAAE